MEPWQEQKHCRNCTAPLTGPYCHQCGERVLTERDRSLSMMFGAFLQGILNFDNKFFRTFKTLVTRPGELTLAYHRGVRQQYLRPVQLFLVANLLYFLFPLLSSLNTSFYTQMHQLPYSEWVRPRLENYLAVQGIAPDRFEQDFNQTSQQVAKLIVVILVPFFGFAFRLFYWNQRNYFLTDFFALAFYFLSFYMLVLLVLIPVLAWPFFWWFEYQPSYFVGEIFYGILTFLSLGAFLAVAFQRLFDPPLFWHLAKAIAVVVLFLPLIQLFRFVLLLVTLMLVA